MKILVTFICILLSLELTANDINVSNVSFTGQDVSAGVNNSANFVKVQFDLSWSNSWRTSLLPVNWDAAWVFVKYRVGGGDWQHARLHNIGHTAPTGSAIDIGLRTPGSVFNATTNPGVGAFVYRSVNGTGTFSISGIQLRWNYGAYGVVDNAAIDVQVYAIEMVYVPQGTFSAGDGTLNNLRGQFRNGATNTPFIINSEAAITLGGTAAANLANNNATGMVPIDDFNNITTQVLPAAFPKGYNKFYCMKYEISQQQYVNFLNTLTRTQQATRVATVVTAGTTSITNRYVMSNSATLGSRNGIRCDATIDANNPIDFYCNLSGNGVGGGSSDGQWIVANYLSYLDLSAYLDWCGLRPMTELEFEKACRGPLAAVPDEYAWGNTIATEASSIINSGTNCEITNSSANASFNNNVNVQGPLRVGVFATAGSTRLEAGATYYGIMEMSGSMMERTVTVGNTTGRGFTGVTGDGVVSINGNANETGWPGLVSGEVTAATGSGFRAGSFDFDSSYMRVSERYYSNYVLASRVDRYGGRGCRVAP